LLLDTLIGIILLTACELIENLLRNWSPGWSKKKKKVKKMKKLPEVNESFEELYKL